MLLPVSNPKQIKHSVDLELVRCQRELISYLRESRRLLLMEWIVVSQQQPSDPNLLPRYAVNLCFPSTKTINFVKINIVHYKLSDNGLNYNYCIMLIYVQMFCDIFLSK